MIRIVLFVTMI